MKIGIKIIIAAAVLLLAMLVLPLVFIKLFASVVGVGLWFICFFAINPIVIIFLGALAGTSLNKLWWIPIVAAALFPVLFGIAIADLVLDLFFYSVIYLPLGLAAMVATDLIKKIFSFRPKK